MALGFTVTIRPAGGTIAAASWSLLSIDTLRALAVQVGATEHCTNGYPYRWTFPAGTFADAAAAAALGAEKRLEVRGDVIVEAWDQS